MTVRHHLREVEQPHALANAPQIYQFDRVPTYIKMAVGGLCVAVALLSVWVLDLRRSLQDQIHINSAKIYVLATEGHLPAEAPPEIGQ